jgi:hypothetical protein
MQIVHLLLADVVWISLILLVSESGTEDRYPSSLAVVGQTDSPPRSA